MKKTKELLAIVLALSMMLFMIPALSLTVSAEAPVAACAVSVSEYNIGADNYYVAADVAFTSNTEFTAGLFTVEAEDLTLTDCTVKSCIGGDSPEVQFEASKNKVIFTGFSNSTENDFKSYTSLTLTLKFSLNDGATGTARKVTVKDINIANVDEVKFVTADASGTADAGHTHTLGSTWEKDAYNHWKICGSCGEKVDNAAHTFGEGVVTAPTCTKGGYTTYTCTVCEYSYTDNETAPTDHTVGDWISDMTDHWHVCTGCAVVMDKAAHISGDWIIDTPATTTAVGHKHKECTICKYHTEEADIAMLDPHVAGDINGDNVLNNKDVTRLLQYLTGWKVTVNEAALDVNGDTKVNNKDLVRLFKYLSGWDVEIL